MNLRGSVGTRAKLDDKVGGVRTCERAAITVVGVAISAWARTVKSLRVNRPLAFLRWYANFLVMSDTTKLPRLVFLTRCPACVWIVGSYIGSVDPQIRRTRLFNVNNASYAFARSVLRCHKHREVVTIDDTDVVIVITTVIS